MISSFFNPTYLSSFKVQVLLPSFVFLFRRLFVCSFAPYFFGSTVTEFVWFVHLLFFTGGAPVVGVGVTGGV